MRQELHAFTVQRSRRYAPFPLDMLRYDCCWPRSDQASALIRGLLDDADDLMERPARFRGPAYPSLDMRGIQPPTVARWASFGWKVVS